MDKEYKQLKKDVEKSFAKVWGPRCKSTDKEDFPGDNLKPEERCQTCRAYDMLDMFLEALKKPL